MELGAMRAQRSIAPVLWVLARPREQGRNPGADGRNRGVQAKARRL